ncbi:MAG: hypothetical protein KJ043_19240 [Anaerolineae bacterium]|nr:hypothetical protein [Anaerolineae bacterium]
MTVLELFQQVQQLSSDEQHQLWLLMQGLMDTQHPKTRNILEFEGFASALADDQDPQDYLRQLRAEWDKNYED